MVSAISKSQQWNWAITADSVFGDQQAKMICRANNHLYVLIAQNARSVINNTSLDSGNVIIKLTTGGQVAWAKHYPGEMHSIYVDNSGTIFFVGNFSGTLNFFNTTFTSKGSKDVYFGALDAGGNKLWVNQAGSPNDDAGNCVVTDSRGMLFIGGQLKDDFSIGSFQTTDKSQLFTFLIRCDAAGNYLDSYSDDATLKRTGLKFQKSASGKIHLSCSRNPSPCPYACYGYEIVKIDPQSFALSREARFSTFEELHSWIIDSDSTFIADYSTGSHYLTSYDLHTVKAGINQHDFKKSMGDGYDGKWAPYIVRDQSLGIVAGCGFNMGWEHGRDTLWYDNLFLVPDSFSTVLLTGIDSSYAYTWLLPSKGTGPSSMTDLISDGQGRFWTTGNYNTHNDPYWTGGNFSHTLTFGNTTLASENMYQRFFIAEAATSSTTGIAGSPGTVSPFKIFPNPTTGVIGLGKDVDATHIRVYNTLGEQVRFETQPGAIDLRSQPNGVYLVYIELNQAQMCKKIVLYK